MAAIRWRGWTLTLLLDPARAGRWTSLFGGQVSHYIFEVMAHGFLSLFIAFIAMRLGTITPLGMICPWSVVLGVTYSQYSATVHVFDGTLMICLWYGEGRVAWGGVGGLIANNVQVYFYTHVMLRYCTFLLHFHTHVMLRYCTFLLHFHTHVMLRYCTFLLHLHT